MAGGLVALLDDIAALTKVAAASIDDIGAAAGKASVKAAGVVVDDTAVTPRYVHGFTPDRELPIVRKIAVGSIRNKLLIILPVAMILSQFLPQALPYLLIAGGLFLCYEGAEKVYEAFGGGLRRPRPGHHRTHHPDHRRVPDRPVPTDMFASPQSFDALRRRSPTPCCANCPPPQSNTLKCSSTVGDYAAPPYIWDSPPTR